VVAAAQQLVMALQGNIPAGNETVEALTKVSKLFTKIALAKKKVAKAKEQRNRLRANPSAWITTHLPRVAVPPPRVDVPVPKGDQSHSGWLPFTSTQITYLQAYEEQDVGRKDQGLPKDSQQDESSRVVTKKAGTWQQMLSGNEGMHQGERHGLWTRPSETTQA
jgi:hypothetical protein